MRHLQAVLNAVKYTQESVSSKDKTPFTKEAVWMKKLPGMILALLLMASMLLSGFAEGTYTFVTRYAETDNITYVFDVLTKEYQKEHPEFELEIVVVPRTDDVVLVSAASGDIPDLMLCGYSETVDILAAQDLICNMEQLMIQAGCRNALEDQYFENRAVRSGTHTFYSLPNSYNVEGLWYNKELFEQVGVKPPETMSEFEAVCEKFLAAGIQPVSLAGLDFPPTRWFQNLVQRQMGSEYADNVDSNVISYTEQPCINSLEKLVEWNDKGYFGESITTVDKSTMLNVFMEGKAAMTYYSTNGTSIFQNGNVQFTMGFFPFFEWEGGVGKRTEMIVTYGWVWCVSEAAVNEELLDWLAYVMPRFGDTALKGVQLITPYATSPEAYEELGYYAKLASDAMDMCTGGFNHSGAGMPAAVVDEFQHQMQYMFLHEATPEDVGRAMDEAFRMYS